MVLQRQTTIPASINARPCSTMTSDSSWSRRRIAAYAAIGAVTLWQAGCGGPPAPAPVIPTEIVKLDPVEVSQRISAYREAHHLGPVILDPSLITIAQAQADAMAGANLLSHEVAGNLDHRLNAAHHAKGYAVENVSAGYATADAAVAGWQRSAPHNANLLYGPMRHMGIAAADAPGTRFKTFWALVMTD
jgi:uncharacterized protein YkwD